MSRVGKSPIPIPQGVTVAMNGQHCVVQGPRGSLAQQVHTDIRVAIDDGQVVVTRPSNGPRSEERRVGKECRL